MPVTQQLIVQFNRMLEKQLFANNSFVKASKDDRATGATVSANAAPGVPSKVSVPQEGANAEGGVNPTNFPLPVQTAYDEVLEYDVNWHYTKPRRIMKPEDMMTNYKTRQQEVENHVKVLERNFAHECLSRWMPTRAEFMVRTSGTDTRTAASKRMSAATGVRKKMIFENIVSITEMFVEYDVPLDGAKALFSAAFLGDLYGDFKKNGFFIPYTTMENALGMQGGVIGKILNFEVMVRSSAGIYTNDSTPVPKDLYSYVPAATDNQAALFWHPDFVRRFEPQVKFFQDVQGATYQSDIVSTGGHGGASKSRKDEVGVFAIVQAHG